MDRFQGKSTPETIDFPIKIMGLSGFNFPDRTNPLKDPTPFGQCEHSPC